MENPLRELRSALTALLTAVRVDPAKPQEAVRILGLDKSLTWKISKVIRTDSVEALRHLPGTLALGLFFDAIHEREASPDAIKRARAAAERLEAEIVRHVGDRATLELVLDPKRLRIRLSSKRVENSLSGATAACGACRRNCGSTRC